MKKKEEEFLVRNVAKEMYVVDSKHVDRLYQFGHNLSYNTIKEKRRFILLIIKVWGDKRIDKIKISDIEQFLLDDKTHSGSWKNSYLGIFSEIYEETKWNCSQTINRPHFKKFCRNSKKADLLTNDEIHQIFSPTNFPSERDFLFWMCTFSFGLRLGEVRALKPNQFLWDKNFLVVNGFCKRNGERTDYNKKGNDSDKKHRLVPIPLITKKLIINWITKNGIKENEFMFQSYLNNPLGHEFMDKQFKSVIAQSGIKQNSRKLVPHSLRYTYITKMRSMLEADQVRRLAGHNSLEMTDYYTRFSIQHLESVLRDSLPACNKLFD